MRRIAWAMVSMALVSCIVWQEYRYKALEARYERLARDSEWGDIDHFNFLDYVTSELRIDPQIILDLWEEYDEAHPVPKDVNYTRTYSQ